MLLILICLRTIFINLNLYAQYVAANAFCVSLVLGGQQPLGHMLGNALRVAVAAAHVSVHPFRLCPLRSQAEINVDYFDWKPFPNHIFRIEIVRSGANPISLRAKRKTNRNEFLSKQEEK